MFQPLNDSREESNFHLPVMREEILSFLNLCPGGKIVDATIGTGGHSLAILKQLMSKGKLIGIDQDQESLKIAKERLSGVSGICEFIHGNFADIDQLLEKINVKKIDGILFDLGISSFQLADPQRGFSFQNQGPLDMRLDKNSPISAYELVNKLNEEELSSLLWNFGEERWHRRIARFLVKERDKNPISTTLELSNIVLRAMPYKHKYSRIHPATRTFQAIRIAVNRELEILEIAICKAIKLLNKKARICVISFHSLEDRIVKFTFRKAAAEGEVKIITPKPLVPSESEIEENPSSRSAKLRVAERL